MSCQQHSNPLAYTLQKRELIGNGYRPLMDLLSQGSWSTICSRFNIINPFTETTMHMYRNACMCTCVHVYMLVRMYFPPQSPAAIGCLTPAAEDILIWSWHIKAAEEQMLNTEFLAYISPWRYQSHTCSSLFIKAVALLVLFVIFLLGNSGTSEPTPSSQSALLGSFFASARTTPCNSSFLRNWASPTTVKSKQKFISYKNLSWLKCSENKDSGIPLFWY